MTSSKLILAAAVSGAATALAFGALPATGQSGPLTGTFVLTGKARAQDTKQVDVKPKGESVGDRLIISETLRGEGRVARAESDCVLVDTTYQGAQCTTSLLFADGQIVLSGASVSKKIPTVGDGGEDYAILGGTGAYAGAAGTVTLKQDSKGDTVTVALR
jgi:hypothetical protein